MLPIFHCNKNRYQVLFVVLYFASSKEIKEWYFFIIFFIKHWTLGNIINVWRVNAELLNLLLYTIALKPFSLRTLIRSLAIFPCFFFSLIWHSFYKVLTESIIQLLDPWCFSPFTLPSLIDISSTSLTFKCCSELATLTARFT